MFDITSIIVICGFEIVTTAKVLSNVWRLFFDTQLSMIVAKLEATHEKLIQLNLVRTMQTKMNFLFITGVIVHLIAIDNIIFQAQALFTNIIECIAFYEYILLILYIRWMVYIINEQIPQRHSTISTLRDMYLEVIECLNDINRSIYGLPAIWSFIGANVSQVELILYYGIIFRRSDETGYVTYIIITILTRLFNVILFYGIGDATEKEINRMSLVLSQRSMIEKNPRIKRQIKFFILRRLHEHYHFKVFGIFGVNLRQLLLLLNNAVGYLVIQSLFRLNRIKNI
ncbi:unnamed protein product [Macrosiphum euphorbiae]|uniref:Gustatory receptor n=1 Tax=Macrosiphum euphorbiae TaxID=13131 RepID=A0AAV0X1C0_9HEMI|nr:unnamed protein product [Macrosiphum euphorbiae]